MVDFYRQVSIPEKQRFTVHVEFDADSHLNHDGCHGTDLGFKPDPLAIEFVELENGEVLVNLGDEVEEQEWYLLSSDTINIYVPTFEKRTPGLWLTTSVGYHEFSRTKKGAVRGTLLSVPFDQAFYNCYLDSKNDLTESQKQIVKRFFESAIVVNHGSPITTK